LPAAASQPERAPTPNERTIWLLTSACGALLLSAVTSHLSQNIAAIPLLWVIPLTIYLLTFVIAFNSGNFYSHRAVRILVVLLMAAAFAGTGYKIANPDLAPPIRSTLPLYCATLFIACLFCHWELFRRRPGPRYATQYYLFIAAGGALGSMARYATGIYVAAHQAPHAIEEAIEAEVPLIVAVAEHIPLHNILRVGAIKTLYSKSCS